MEITQKFKLYSEHKHSIRFAPDVQPQEVPIATSVYVDRKYVSPQTRVITLTLKVDEPAKV